MLWSLLKIAIFLGLAAALAFAAAWVIETPGEVRVAFGGREFFVSPIGFLIGTVALIVLALLLLKLIGFLVAVVRFLLGDETAISRYFARSRERRGFDAFSDGMIALATGDAKAAAKQAAKAKRLLNRPELTLPLKARAAEMNGDRAGALEAYKEMLPNDRTRPVGINGLMHLKLEEGDTDTALELAKKAFALQPRSEGILRTLFDLQTRKADWSGARSTMVAATNVRMLPRDVGTRRDAVLSLADARAALAEGNEARGNAAALQASKLAPTLIPAAALAARAQIGTGAKRKAARTLATAWETNPHPDLAAAFAAIEPGESPEARRKRFATLTSAAPNHLESRLLTAEMALAAEDFPAARKALGDLAETEPTTRSLALMAAIERGQGAPDAVVRGWLAKALNASRGPQWICGKCNHVHAGWVPVCENCGAFDTLDWRAAPHAEDAGIADSALLPLIIGADGPVGEPPQPDIATPPRPDVEDAELAGGPGRAARL